MSRSGVDCDAQVTLGSAEFHRRGAVRVGGLGLGYCDDDLVIVYGDCGGWMLKASLATVGEDGYEDRTGEHCALIVD